jgi:hypothetical protein
VVPLAVAYIAVGATAAVAGAVLSDARLSLVRFCLTLGYITLCWPWELVLGSTAAFMAREGATTPRLYSPPGVPDVTTRPTLPAFAPDTEVQG